MTTENLYDIAVIGGGAAGTMAAQRSVLNNDKTILFPGSPKDRKKSRAFWVAHVENMPALFDYKKAIVDSAKETFDFLESGPFSERFTLQKNRGVLKISKNDQGLFELEDSKGEQTLARFVVLCTGIMDVQPVISGSIAPILPYANVQVVDYCLRCDGHLTYGKDTAVIGHTDSASWVAIMLYERYGNPSMKVMTHGEKPNFSEQTIQLMKKYNIQVIEEEITEVIGEAKQKNLQALQLKSGQQIPVQFAFVSLGSIVYNDLAKQLGVELDRRGLVITGQKGETNIPGFYAAGDIRSVGKNQIYTAWDQAVDCCDDINAKIRLNKRSI